MYFLPLSNNKLSNGILSHFWIKTLKIVLLPTLNNKLPQTILVQACFNCQFEKFSLKTLWPAFLHPNGLWPVDVPTNPPSKVLQSKLKDPNFLFPKELASRRKSGPNLEHPATRKYLER